MEFNLTCFKCDSKTNLSVKYYTRVSREPRLICNDCRKLYNKNKAPRRNVKQEFNRENWDILAKECYERLNRRTHAIPGRT